METQLFKLNLAFRGLSDEDEEEVGVDAPEVLEDDDEDDVKEVVAPEEEKEPPAEE